MKYSLLPLDLTTFQFQVSFFLAPASQLYNLIQLLQT